jgi:hypothetical protein
MENKKNLALIFGVSGAFLIIISVLLLKDGTTRGTVTSSRHRPPLVPPQTKQNPINCRVTFHKVLKSYILTYCYNGEKNGGGGEFISIYSKVNGTEIIWKGQKLFTISSWMKKVFEDYSRTMMNNNSRTHKACCDYYMFDPTIYLKFRQNVLQYGELEYLYTMSARAIYTLYYWLSF